jgi:hypothetical protein
VPFGVLALVERVECGAAVVITHSDVAAEVVSWPAFDATDVGRVMVFVRTCAFGWAGLVVDSKFAAVAADDAGIVVHFAVVAVISLTYGARQ